MKKNVLSFLLTLLVLLIITIIVLPQFAEYGEVVDTIRTLTGTDITIILIVTIINILVYVLPFMAATPSLRYGPAFIVRQTSFLMSNALPGGGAIGVGVQYAMTTSYKIKGAIASSGIVSTSIWNILTTMALPGLAVLVFWLSVREPLTNSLAAIIGVVIAAVSNGGFTLLMKSERLTIKISKKLEKLFSWLNRRIKKLPKINITKSLLEFRKTTYHVTTKRWPLLILANFAQQFMQYAVLFVILRALGVDSVSAIAIFAAFAFARFGTFIPLTPGGLGTVDVIQISLLVEAGVPTEIATAATLLWRTATYFPQLAIGVITFLYWRATSSKRKRH